MALQHDPIKGREADSGVTNRQMIIYNTLFLLIIFWKPAICGIGLQKTHASGRPLTG
jgi:hypothetical protein